MQERLGFFYFKPDHMWEGSCYWGGKCGFSGNTWSTKKKNQNLSIQTTFVYDFLYFKMTVFLLCGKSFWLLLLFEEMKPPYTKMSTRVKESNNKLNQRKRRALQTKIE